MVVTLMGHLLVHGRRALLEGGMASDVSIAVEDGRIARIEQGSTQRTRDAAYPALLGIEIVEITPGRLRCRLPVADRLMSGAGAVHGGAIASLVDHAISLVVYPLVERNKWVATVELKLNYLAPVREGEIIADAQVLALGRQVGTVRVDVHSGEDLCATALGTVYVRERLGTPTGR